MAVTFRAYCDEYRAAHSAADADLHVGRLRRFEAYLKGAGHRLRYCPTDAVQRFVDTLAKAFPVATIQLHVDAVNEYLRWLATNDHPEIRDRLVKPAMPEARQAPPDSRPAGQGGSNGGGGGRIVVPGRLDPVPASRSMGRRVEVGIPPGVVRRRVGRPRGS